MFFMFHTFDVFINKLCAKKYLHILKNLIAIVSIKLICKFSLDLFDVTIYN